MSQKKLKKKGLDVPAAVVEDVPTKKDYSIASYMKKNTPTKRTKFLHHQVDYFYASKAIDVLLDSQWATGKDPIFTDRQSVVIYCNKLLTYKFFHRAKKIPITDKDLKPKELKKKREKEEREKNKKEKEKRKKKDPSESKDESEDPKKDDEGQTDDEQEQSKKKKRKIKLDMHLEQVFLDGSDAYVWMYDPVPFWYYIAGALCLLAAVAICLFPLWPPAVRKGVYYLSVAAACFLGFILGLAVLRCVVFLLIWVLSMGRHHLWLLPNLTEDVGFFASFWPLYHYEYRGADFDRKKSKKNKKKVVLKTSSETEEDGKKSDREAQDNASAGDTDRHETDRERREDSTNNPSDSENSQHSQPFEMVDRNELVGNERRKEGSEEESDEENDRGEDEQEDESEGESEGEGEGEGEGERSPQ